MAATSDESGVVSHSETYSFGYAGRLTQVVDTATSQTELYTWNPDTTLASYPGPGYTRRLEYDEERRLIRIKKDFGGGNIQTAFEYAYGADGGRRWRKDIAANKWTWYPCGVACCAGELVEMESTLAGGIWTTTAQYLKGASLVRRNSEFHHVDSFGLFGIVTDATATMVSDQLYDFFGVRRSNAGFATTPWRFSLTGEEASVYVGSLTYLPGPSLQAQQKPPYGPPSPPPSPKPGPRRNCAAEQTWCMTAEQGKLAACIAGVAALVASLLALCNLNPEPITKTLCIRRVIITGTTLGGACYINFKYNMEVCRRNYGECVRQGGIP